MEKRRITILNSGDITHQFEVDSDTIVKIGDFKIKVSQFTNINSIDANIKNDISKFFFFKEPKLD
ncbi:hypothetical protein [Anoxybacillus flavithermus]|uniref:hypothetical protein n=1 Tax=Anoxybacillus flavithermus TaxID=33934 RepID=UPI001865ACF9|nr:hypothetical protein [Anoxybacillus flavithermus]MBE2930584.1 hypothetical protein [Anoxybacillus flavithermus]MBE2957584.1 hypothetical protein [Anoxybacillus flavithermus]